MVTSEDVRSGQYFGIPTWIIDDYGDKIGVYGIAVCGVLSLLSRGTKSCFAPISRIAEWIGCSERQVQKTLRDLERHGIIGSRPAINTSTLKPSDGLSCGICGLPYPILHKHRIKPGKEGGTYQKDNVTWLCPNCHTLVHSREYVLEWGQNDL